MNKMNYQEPWMRLIALAEEDVLTASWEPDPWETGDDDVL